MSLIVSIDTSTKVCSVALHKEGKLLGLSELFTEKSHSGMLTTLVENVVKQAGYELSQLDAIAVAKGPGSYTGLRIGVSTAKGLSFALDKPLIAVGTLAMMANGYMQKHPNYGGLICPMIDARRMEVYTTIFDLSLNVITPTEAKIIDEMVIREAKLLLTSHVMNISEVAMELHFSNSSFFGKYFKKQTGITPSEYKLSNNIAV